MRYILILYQSSSSFIIQATILFYVLVYIDPWQVWWITCQGEEWVFQPAGEGMQVKVHSDEQSLVYEKVCIAIHALFALKMPRGPGLSPSHLI